MSRNHPLTYPPPKPQGRHFHPLKLIPMEEATSIFDAIFGHRFMREHFKKFSGHGTIPIILGAAVVAEGHSHLLVRSIAVFVCTMWFSLDVGVWISEAKWQRQYKAMAFCIACAVLCCCSMGIMYWFLSSMLEGQRDNVFQNLAFSYHMLPGEEDNPMHTIFTVVNNSPYVVSRKHHIGCELLLAVDNNGHNYIRAQGRPIVADPDSKLWIAPAAGDLSPMRTLTQSTMGPGGSDAESSECLIWFGLPPAGADCVDLKVIFWYSLENQPDFDQEKKVRYVAVKSKDGRFSWVQQSVDSLKMYCDEFYKGPGQPPFH